MQTFLNSSLTRLIITILLTKAFAFAQEVPIPQTAFNSLYKYYMLEVSQNDTNHLATYKAVGPSGFLFLRTEINCTARSTQDIGSSVRSAKDIPNTPKGWIKPRIGTIQFDLVSLVCK